MKIGAFQASFKFTPSKVRGKASSSWPPANVSMVSKIKSIHNEQLKDNMMVKVTTAACPVPREYTFKKVI